MPSGRVMSGSPGPSVAWRVLPIRAGGHSYAPKKLLRPAVVVQIRPRKKLLRPAVVAWRASRGPVLRPAVAKLPRPAVAQKKKQKHQDNWLWIPNVTLGLAGWRSFDRRAL